MNNFFTSLFLLLFLPQSGWSQGLTCEKDIGMLFNWSARQNITYQNGTRDFVNFKSSSLQISPFISKSYFERWEFGLRGAFIWNRQTEIEQKRGDIFIERKDLFVLSGGLITRINFDYPDQKMRTFLHLDNQLLFEIGKNEISEIAGLISFGIGAMYQLNSQFAIESMIATRLFSLNVTNIEGIDLGLQFWLGLRYCIEKKSAP